MSVQWKPVFRNGRSVQAVPFEARSWKRISHY